MKTLTLNEAWKWCIEQWTWIVAELVKNPNASVTTLKAKWFRLKMPKYENKILRDCFFCEYAHHHKGCLRSCPAMLVDKGFGCCNCAYDYYYHPQAFLAKLLELDKKRKSKKGK